MTKWKYMTAQFVTAGLGEQATVEKVQENMTALGLYGWELVSTNVYHNSDIGQDVLIMFFKKPTKDDVLQPAPSRVK
jgi:hypothetical protein